MQRPRNRRLLTDSAISHGTRPSDCRPPPVSAAPLACAPIARLMRGPQYRRSTLYWSRRHFGDHYMNALMR